MLARLLLVATLTLFQAPVPAMSARSGGVVDRSSAFAGGYTERPSPGSACEDRDPSCGNWAATGECDRNAGFMTTRCPKSCGSCAPPAEGPAQSLGTEQRDVVTFTTSAGAFNVVLRDDISPRTAAYVKQVAAGGLCNNSTSCRFYRAEPIPPPGAIDNFGGPGPPYALVQGSLASTLFTAIEREGAPLVQRGDACLIGTGPDFFIAVGPHPEWGNGHTVWGRVQGSMAAVDAIVEQPLKEETWGETHVRVLVSPMSFTLSTHAV